MKTNERLETILKYLDENRTVNVSELSRKLFVSEATIRRDLEKLERRGQLHRTYGGAMRMDSIDTESPFNLRFDANAKAKEHMAELAVQLIEDGNVITMDSSTSALYLCSHFQKFRNLTVLTHGSKALERLQEIPNINVYCAGGLLQHGTYSLFGEFTRQFYSSFYTDIAFISCKGISIKNGPSWAYDEEAALRRIMMQNTKKRVLLCDNSKMNATYTSKLFGMELIDVVITNKKPDEAWSEYFEKSYVKVMY